MKNSKGVNNNGNNNNCRETEYFLIAAQNNAIGTNYVKAKIDMTPQNVGYVLI